MVGGMTVVFMAHVIVAVSEQVSNWRAYLEDHPTDAANKYVLVFEWDHVHDQAIMVDGENGGKVMNAENDVRCNGDSSVVASDGVPFWMPRFFPKNVSAEITRVTGVQFVSADWQPCGHKEVTICHAESHYDFHMYYEEEAVMNALPMCQIGAPSNSDLPVCRDSASIESNHDYFRLINNSIPLSLKASSPGGGGVIEKQTDFCVDPSSAILRSGVHYGDSSETMQEWKTPVTIIGSHNCELKFFEPMFSWKWVSGCIRSDQTSWPVYEVNDIQYTKKGIESLPDSWRIEVSESCKATDCYPTEMDPPASDTCGIKLVVVGNRCPEEGCKVVGECGNMKDCNTKKMYVSPFVEPEPEPEPCIGMCTKEYRPVCGSDGVTYSNVCLFEQRACSRNITMTQQSACGTLAPEDSYSGTSCTHWEYVVVLTVVVINIIAPY